MKKTGKFRSEIVVYTVEEAYSSVSRLCAQREVSPHTIKDRLHKKGLSLQQSLVVIEKLRTNGFISDERFAKAFSHDKMLLKGWGKQRIQLALKMEGISDNAIKRTLFAENQEAYEALIEREAKKQILKLKSRSIADRNKIYRFLLRRGFEVEMIKKTIDKLW